MTLDTEVLIVGGGLNGPALALSLAQGGVASIVVDTVPPARHTDPAFDGRAYALSLTSVNMLRALGLWPDLAGHAQPMLDIKVSDGRAGEGAAPWYLHFDHRELDEGPVGHMLEDRFLRRALHDAMQATPLVTHLAPQKVVGQQTGAGHARVTLDDGRTLSALLVVGCDGRQSPTALRAGIARLRKDYKQTALVCAVAHEKPHNGIAHQFFMPSGPLAILPLPGEKSSIVWTETRERAAAINAMDDTAYLAELRPRFGDFLGTLSLAGKRFSYPLDLTLAQRFTAARVALAGDAAHGVHPLAGQGLNLGLRDVATLAEVLTEAARRGEDIGSAVTLDAYARWRRSDTAMLVAATDVINTVFSNDNPLLRLGRDLALGALDAMPAARRFLMREATGLNGDLPRLLRGTPL